MSASPSKAVYRHIPITQLSADELLDLSKKHKLSLSREDMVIIQAMFKEENREPTDVELEVIAQTWSEHCKHRIFDGRLESRLRFISDESIWQGYPCLRLRPKPSSATFPSPPWATMNSSL